ncbi:hypothetical protein [Dictyobacter kobayashii]|uniref:Uncharacterized protein n=1 Tax=Dictyobacter kobayashii TaxID=2014872 RepID=A0A402AKW8_9CHLR|nr:hypothetical protein [Dictyobacter kobayashii]GCE19660.1 hypothetical protein KDK_34600 [Dictyobacter kobayashii]
MSLFYRFVPRPRRGVAGIHVRPQSFIFLACMLFLFSMVISACISDSNSNNGGNAHTSAAATPAPVQLSSLGWCGKPSEIFRDQASDHVQAGAKSTDLGPADGKPRTVTDWNTVKSDLGFTIYLPKSLPAGTCLLSVSGSLRDPIFGSNFTITYVLPGQDAMSFSQAPVRVKNITFQCTVSQGTASTANSTNTHGSASTPTAAKEPVQLCNGIRDQTNIVFSARGNTSTLQQIFQNLQPDVDWTPAK